MSSDRKASVILTVEVSVALAALTALLYSFPYHLVYQERYQMFQFTLAYLAEVLSQPGGLCDYVGRFLTQFFMFPWAGALLMGLLYAGISVLVWHLTGARTLYLMPISLIPAILMAAYALDANALPGAAVSLLVVTAAAKAVLPMRDDHAAAAVAALLVPVLYWACGPLCIVFVLVVGKRDWKLVLPGLLLSAAMPLIAWTFMHLPLRSLLVGVHYHRFPLTIPVLPWVAAASVVVLAWTERFLKDSRNAVVASAMMFLIVAAGGFFLSSRMQSLKCRHREESFRYLFLLQDCRWEDIKDASLKRFPSQNPSATAAINLAYAMTDGLPGKLFSRFQNGPQGLIPPFHLDFITPLTGAGIFWSLGMVNDAQRYAYEAQETIPDHQKSSLCCRMIASASLAAGHDDVARKYLSSLDRTLFYRKWARNAPHDPVIAGARTMSLPSSDLLFSEDRIPRMLEEVCEACEDNLPARDYCLCDLLLQTDLRSFSDAFARMWHRDVVIPEVYAEGLLLGWAEGHPDFTDFPWDVSDSLKDSCAQFIDLVKSGASKATARQRYGDTYWFYFFYHDAK